MGRDWISHTQLVGVYITWCRYFGKMSQFLKWFNIVWAYHPAILLLGMYAPKRNENMCPHKSLYMNVHGSISHNSTNIETTQRRINRWMEKQSVVCPWVYVLSLFNPMDCSLPGSSVHWNFRFYWQEHWSGLPCPPPGDFPHPVVEPYISYIGRWILDHYIHTMECCLAMKRNRVLIYVTTWVNTTHVIIPCLSYPIYLKEALQWFAFLIPVSLLTEHLFLGRLGFRKLLLDWITSIASPVPTYTMSQSLFKITKLASFICFHSESESWYIRLFSMLPDFHAPRERIQLSLAGG